MVREIRDVIENIMNLYLYFGDLQWIPYFGEHRGF